MCQATCRGPRALSLTTVANLDCVFVENPLIFVVPKIGRALAPLGSLYEPSVLNSSLCLVAKEVVVFCRDRDKPFNAEPRHCTSKCIAHVLFS